MCAIMAVFFTMALLDYWPPSPYSLIIGVGLALASAWFFGLGAIWVRNTLRARRRADTNAEIPPT